MNVDAVDLLLPIGFGVFFVAVFALAIVAGIRQQRQISANLQQLATRLGLKLDPSVAQPGAKMSEVRGIYRGRALRLFTYTTGSGKNRVRWCAISVSTPNPKRLTLRIAAENILTRAGHALGIDDVSIGDDIFDRQFYVKSNDPAYVRVGLLPEWRARMTALWAKGARGTISVEGDEVKYAEVGSFAKNAICERVPAAAELLCDLGEIVEAHAT